MAPHFIFTRHALDVMEERQVLPEWVERTVEGPDAQEPDPTDPALTRAFRAIPERDGRVLRVVYAQEPDAVRIITAFFDRGRRR